MYEDKIGIVYLAKPHQEKFTDKVLRSSCNQRRSRLMISFSKLGGGRLRRAKLLGFRQNEVLCSLSKRRRPKLPRQQVRPTTKVN